MSLLRLFLLLALSVFISLTGFAQSRSWASKEFVEESQEFHRRAIEAAVWGMPIVAMDAMRQAYFRDAQAKYNDVVFLAL